MKFDNVKPCKSCPFRRKSVPGWLGAATPKDFIAATMQDELMPCHETVDYDANWWSAEMLRSESKVRHCAGARIFFKNHCKMSRNQRYVDAKKLKGFREVEKSADVFSHESEFLAHHAALARKSKVKEDDEETHECGECGCKFPISIVTGCPECGA